MKWYSYTGLTTEGKRVTGQMWADSTQEVHQKLGRDHIRLIRLVDKQVKQKGWSKKKVIAFAYQMSLLLEAGISLRRIFSMLVDRPHPPATYVSMAASLQKGRSLSDALAETGFPSLGQTLVEAGEMSGNLGSAFRFIQSYYEKEKRWQSQVQSAMSYPLFLLGLMVVFFLVAILFILPSFQQVFTTMHVELPLLTRVLFAMGNLVTAHWQGCVLAHLLVVLGLIGAWKQERWRRRVSAWLWTHLHSYRWFHSFYLARMTTVWAMLLDSGISLLDTLKVSAPLWGQSYATACQEEIIQRIEAGNSFGQALANSPVGTPFLQELVVMGEETGELVQLLEHAATYYEKQMDHYMALLGQYMEPCMISCMGIGVGTLVIAVMLPMFRSISALTNL